MTLIRLQLIGRLRVITEAGQDFAPKGRKAQAVLAVLALSSTSTMSRIRLSALLWERSHPDQARALLRGAVYELQNSLQSTGVRLLEATRDGLVLRRDNLTLDTEELFADPQLKATTVAGAHGPTLLEGLDYLGPAFDKWLSEARSNFTERIRSALELTRFAEERHQAIERLDQRLAEMSTTDQAVPVHSGDARRTLWTGAHLLQERSPTRTTSPNSSTVTLQHRKGVRIGVNSLRCFSPAGLDPLAFALTDEIRTALARFRWISVIASDLVAATAELSRDIQASPIDLNLDFLLDGQIQASSGKVRIRASLVDAREMSIVWTFKTDRDVSDLLTFQDEIAAEVAARVDSHLLQSETQRVLQPNLESSGAYGLVLQAISAACRLERTSFQHAGTLLEEALKLEPNQTIAHTSMAQYQIIAASQGWADDPTAALMRAEQAAVTALSLDPSEAPALTILGHVRSILHRRPEEATALHNQAIEINPNQPFAWHFAAANFLVLGQLEQARRCLERHRQLGPSGVHFFAEAVFALQHLLEGDYESTLEVARNSIQLHPHFIAPYKPHLAALGHLGLHAEAQAVRAKLFELDPSFTLRAFRDSSSFRRLEDKQRFEEGLRMAGLE